MHLLEQSDYPCELVDVEDTFATTARHNTESDICLILSVFVWISGHHLDLLRKL